MSLQDLAKFNACPLCGNKNNLFLKKTLKSQINVDSRVGLNYHAESEEHTIQCHLCSIVIGPAVFIEYLIHDWNRLSCYKCRHMNEPHEIDDLIIHRR